MSKAQTDAVVARVQSVPDQSAKTWTLVAPRDAVGKLPTPPYTVVQPSDGTNTADRFTGPRSVSHPRFVLHFVGSSYDNAQATLERVKAKFIDPVSKFPILLTVSGESVKNFIWESPLPVQVDNDVTPPLLYASAEISWDAETL